MSDEFAFLDKATPIHSDSDDPVRSKINQHEADESRSAVGTTGADQFVSETSAIPLRDGVVSQCRYCQERFRTDTDDENHSCPKQPVASCRYCKEEHFSRDAADNHLYHCEPFRRARAKEHKQQRVHAMHGQGDPQPGRFIDPWYHELRAYVKYDCSDKPSPLKSYSGFSDLQKEHDFEQYGNLQLEMRGDFNGIKSDDLTVEFGFKGSGIAPSEDPDFKLEEVREYQIYIYPGEYEDYSEAADNGRQRAHFLIRPRWPGIASESGSEIPNPHDITGFDIEFTGSNIPFTTYPELLHSAVTRLKGRQGFRWEGPTYLRPNDFHPENIHKSSNIVDAELYVRVKKEYTRRVYAIDGTLHRISLLLSDERRGYTKSIRDDRECPGYYHTATIGPDRISEMIPGHEWPREHKHYHVKHPKAIEGGPLNQPKISVSLQSSLVAKTPKWSQLDILERELDEALLNVLKWSDIPIRQDNQVYVEDDYFKATASQRFRKLLHGQLPRIETMQDREVKQLVVAGTTTETDVQLLETLLTDGGNHSPASLAEKIDCALSTVYKSIDRLGELVNHRYNDVQLTSQYIAQQIVRHLDAVKQSINTDLETAVDELVRAEEFADPQGADPWSLWLQNWVENIRENTDGPDELILGFEPADVSEARRIIREGAGKWAQVTGKDRVDFGHEFVPVVQTRSGEVWSPSQWNFLPGLAGFKSRYLPV
ncbi:Lrp/AsnC family transcriptional regulator [Halobacteria archaeon AArc-m2/3/4]|uniref:Lrp/AsnC family transcriptional regulator n=1 Tax=Natronoglomus mannanivorans TaxID=2979990 RepID=A0ABT2Q8A5_9EURY|nr:Lrp/AsnC family transcriptional regulator [Halobacteria archaeon AArc-m2/3/4]